MTNPSAWAFAPALALVLAFLAAWAITAAPERPITREPIGVPLRVTQPTSWQLPEPGDWAAPRAIPPHVAEEPETFSSLPVVPLWLVNWEEQQRQAERRRALEAAAIGRPDTGYTYPGAHHIPGSVT
ncbi:hypothetical protein [Kitasatospora sp. NBC_01266]|uniref:hypothetical protein n=1 Tax=Kitasatospora sp. NBC_01266 TaxID=2903572 RepID=UPI002E2F7AEA|nr:hypothetical protein [Kitasatospora sp. NBC_01266]